MGACFAPSIANLFMGEWEDKCVFANRKEGLLFYRRFIDDLFFIWKGDKCSLHEFMRELNSNKNNIKLEYEYSREHIHFLDVDVIRQGPTLITTIYFKLTDRNSYLLLISGHHPHWLKNIPKGQFMRVRRNCTTDDDFITHSKVISDRFLQKGYKEQHLDNIVREVAETPRDVCLNDRERQPNPRQEWGFISDFHI